MFGIQAWMGLRCGVRIRDGNIRVFYLLENFLSLNYNVCFIDREELAESEKDLMDVNEMLTFNRSSVMKSMKQASLAAAAGPLYQPLSDDELSESWNLSYNVRLTRSVSPSSSQSSTTEWMATADTSDRQLEVSTGYRKLQRSVSDSFDMTAFYIELSRVEREVQQEWARQRRDREEQQRSRRQSARSDAEKRREQLHSERLCKKMQREALCLQREAEVRSQIENVRAAVTRLEVRLETAQKTQYRLDVGLFLTLSVCIVVAYAFKGVVVERSAGTFVSFSSLEMSSLCFDWLSRQTKSFCGHLQDCTSDHAVVNQYAVVRSSSFLSHYPLKLAPYSYVIGDLGAWASVSLRRAVPYYEQAQCLGLLLRTVLLPVLASLLLRWTG